MRFDSEGEEIEGTIYLTTYGKNLFDLKINNNYLYYTDSTF